MLGTWLRRPAQPNRNRSREDGLHPAMLRQGHDRGELGQLGQLGQLFTWLSSLIDLGNLERLLLDFLEPSCWL